MFRAGIIACLLVFVSGPASAGFCANALAGKVTAVFPFTSWIRFEFGEAGHPDRIVMREKMGWFRYTERVLYQGRITRIPTRGRQQVPRRVRDRVSSYLHAEDPHDPHFIFTVTVADGVFILSSVSPYSGLGLFNYAGHSTDTVFFLSQDRPKKYIAGAWIRGLGSYEGVEHERTMYDSPYVLAALRESDHAGGMAPSEAYRLASLIYRTEFEGYKTEVPFAPLETWLVKAIRPPTDDFSNAKFYYYGGPALRVGDGDYTQQLSIEFTPTNQLILTPHTDNAGIHLADPTTRPPVTIDLTLLD